jgi:hypothetical protein
MFDAFIIMKVHGVGMGLPTHEGVNRDSTYCERCFHAPPFDEI